MKITRENLDTIDFDTIEIKPIWNMPKEKECGMHSIHAYPAKFPAFITTQAISLAEANHIKVDTVADIFCGCGTVAFETVRNGKNFWGCDINPVATLIAEVKSQSYEDCILERYYANICVLFDCIQVDEKDMIFQNQRIRYWFDEEHIIDLWKLKEAIHKSVDSDKYLKFYLCAFSNILKPCSRWLTKAIKPQIDPHKIPSDVMQAFNKQVKMMRKANLSNMYMMNGHADIVVGNFLKESTQEQSVDLVVTSPPYVTSYEYADLHQLSTLWLGYTDDYRTFREGTIGSVHHADAYQSNISKLNRTGRNIVDALYTIEKNKTKSVAQYYIDMQQAVKKVSTMLSREGACLFVIGNTEYKGVKIDNAKHLTECLISAGFTSVNVDRRKISNKILTPYRDANGKFASMIGSSRKVYSEEFVIFAKK